MNKILGDIGVEKMFENKILTTVMIILIFYFQIQIYKQ